MRRKTFIMPGRVTTVACTLMMAAAAMVTSCKDEVLTGQPSWLGNSIYERLQEEGNYTTVLRLIDDLEQREVLAHTGSKTLFVADDDAYKEWFTHNDWGVRSYADLTTAQKKLLLNNAMIDNAYLIELMSNSKAKSDNGTPKEGTAMRRETSVSIYDSVYIMQPSEFPATKAWDELREAGKAIPIFRDMTEPPMIHFLPAFMRYHKITDEDLAILTNQQAQSTAEAWVNGKRVSTRDITCKNGYIQKVDGVIQSTPNMAEIVHQHGGLTQWARLLDRFSLPVRDDDGMGEFGTFSKEYNRLYKRNEFAYFLSYNSDRYANNALVKTAQDKNDIGGKLVFDPGWNQYVDARLDVDLHNDGGVMIAPTNAALDDFWNGEGRALKEEFGSWDNVDIKVLTSLIRNHQLGTFTEAVPSKFGNVLNDAYEQLGITPADVDSCFMGCNGVVYMTNKVFMPVEFRSVLAPALLHTKTMNIVYWALTGAELFYLEHRNSAGKIESTETFPFNYKPFLLSMNSRYGLLLPSNDALQNFIDPYSYGNGGEVTNVSEEGDSTTQLKMTSVEWEFDRSKRQDEYVQAKTHDVVVQSDGTLTDLGNTPTKLSKERIRNLLENFLEQLIIVIPDSTKQKTIADYVNEGYPYFLTKGGSIVRASKGANGNLCFEGGWQMEGHGAPVEVSETYTEGNGVSYQLNGQLPLSASKSLLMVLDEHEEYHAFRELAKNDLTGLFGWRLKAGTGNNNTFTAGSRKLNNENMLLFDNYNYTVYVPTSSVIEKLQDDGYLPSVDVVNIDFLDSKQLDKVDSVILADGLMDHDLYRSYGSADQRRCRSTMKELIKNIVRDFVRYHVQDHSIAVGLASDRYSGQFESMKRNPLNNRFFTLGVKYDNQQITVTDELGQQHHVITTPGLYNNVIREYWYSGQLLRMSSDAVVHLIDGVLNYEKMKPWRQIVREAMDEAYPATK